MNASGWIQLLIFCVALVLITKPMGIYLIRVLDPEVEGGMGIFEKAFGWLERLIYKVGGVDPKKQQNWKQYAMAVLIFGAVATVFSYGCYRLQDVLPLKQNIASLTNTVDKSNPNAIVAPTLDDKGKVTAGGKVSPIIAFIQAISFSTNTDWQSYEPEVTYTYFSQIVPTLIHFFFSAIVGIAVAAALVRGVVRRQSNVIGNFWVDLTRCTLYLFIPICLVFALLDVWQGIPMNFKPYTSVNALDQSSAAAGSTAKQSILQGPMAAYCAPKVLGLNGPGFTGADCAHPFENPTGLSEFLQLMLFFSIISGLTHYYGRMVKNKLHGWNIWLVMFIMLLTTLLVTWKAESTPNPRLAELGLSTNSTNMEGKETRIGIYNSAAWANDVTDTAEGANNCAHDSMTPLAGFMLMFNMHMDEVIFGGIGSGLFGILVFIFCAVFLAGLMIGRTPEYLGKKIEALDVKYAILYLLVMAIGSLGFTAWAVVTGWGASNTSNSGPHGFSEIFYAYSSGCANNGTAFGGYGYTPTVTKPDGTTVYGYKDSSGNIVEGTPPKMFNITQSYCMLFGRYFEIVPILALAGALARKKAAPVNIGSFPVVGPTFVLLVIGVVVIVGALTFLPGLAMGPLLEHFIMTGSKVLY